ncbi:MAG: hypothetical protein ORN85_04965 [Sediminibacterium sp.]|nr:hypothetical protein [Sediminibacterium sp.]
MYLGAFLLGLYSYFMPGGVNLGVVSLIERKNFKKIFIYLLFIVLAEYIYSFIFFYIFFNLDFNQLIKRIIEWTSLGLLLAIAIWSWFDKGKQNLKHEHKGIMQRAFFLIIVHPQQIFYWIIVGELISKKNWFELNLANYLLFMTVYCVGVICCLMIYGYVGFKLISFFSLNYQIINKIMAIFYVLTALIMFLNI